MKKLLTTKKFVTLILAFTLILAVSAQALASTNETRTARVYIGDVIDTNATPGPISRATTAPTSYAPSSWYNTSHTWSATNYTYTLYKFNTTSYPYLNVESNGAITIEFYRANGNYWGSDTPTYNSSTKKYSGAYFFYANEDYYMIIRNSSNATTVSGSYTVSSQY